MTAADPSSKPRRGHGNGWLLLLAASVAWRAMLAWRTPIPSEDGVTYLWMAQRFAAGEPCAPLGEVFPPLTSLAVALPIAIGVDPFRAAQLVLTLAGTVALWPLLRSAHRVAPSGCGAAVGWIAALAPQPAHQAVEVYSEPLFYPLAAAAVAAGLGARLGWLGALAGAAFWVRPEAVALVLAAAVAQPRRAWRAVLPFALAVAALGAVRAACGHGFDPLPKLAFLWESSAVGAPGAAWRRVLGNAARLPGLWLEAFGVLGVLAVVGALARPRGRHAVLLLSVVAAILAAACAYQPRRRFLTSALPAVVPLAAAGLARVPARLRAAVVAAAVVTSLGLGWRTTDPNRSAERDVGAYLAQQLGAGERVVGDMARVLYYAGQRPPPPRHFSAEEIAAAARAPGVRFVVLGSRRETTPIASAALAAAYDVLPLPAELERAASERGILVLARRE